MPTQALVTGGVGGATGATTAFTEAASFLLGTSGWSSVVIDASAAFLLTADEGILTATEGQASYVQENHRMRVSANGGVDDSKMSSRVVA